MATWPQTAARTETDWLVKSILTTKVTIDSTCLDAGNTGQTHILRSGLLVSLDSVSAAYVHYQPTGSNGAETAEYILIDQVDLKDGDAGGTSVDHTANVLVIGKAKAASVLLYDAAALADLLKGGGGEGWIVFV